MPRSISLRWKILAILILPTVIIVGLAAALIVPAVQDARTATYVEAVAPTGEALTNYENDIQVELRATLLSDARADAVPADAVATARKATDGSRIRLVSQLQGLQSDSAARDFDRTAVQASIDSTRSLESLRVQIDKKNLPPGDIAAGYGQVIDGVGPALLALINRVKDPELESSLRAYTYSSALADAARTEASVITATYLSGKSSPALVTQMASLAAEQDLLLANLSDAAPAEVRIYLAADLATIITFPLITGRQVFGQLLAGQDVQQPDWLPASDARLRAFDDARASLQQTVAVQAKTVARQETRRYELFTALAVLVLAVALVQGLLLARRVTRPVTALTRTAQDIARELPEMVERLQTPGADPGLAISPLTGSGKDELGRLATAFNDVNATTVRVAKEQAALRGAIASMFINVARRNQALLGRQLTTLERLESRENDPDVLEELFHVDHLTTRMQRNAESLLVLAGIDTTRRSRQALALSDVVRTAISEIEQYSRVDLHADSDPAVAGRHVLVTAHLIAELLENGTRFSDPTTRVQVWTSQDSQAVRVTIMDRGLGMSEEDLQQARHKMDLPPASETAFSDRLGFFVIGRLAQKLGASVTLHAGSAGGTVAEVALPLSVLEGYQPAGLAGDAPALGAAQAPVVSVPSQAGPLAAAPPVHQAAAPVHQAAAPPVHQAAAPIYQAAAPVHQAAAPIHQAALPPVPAPVPVPQQIGAIAPGFAGPSVLPGLPQRAAAPPPAENVGAVRHEHTAPLAGLAQHTAPVPPVQHVQPVQPVQHAQHVQHVQHAQHAQHVQPVQHVQHVQHQAPVHPPQAPPVHAAPLPAGPALPARVPAQAVSVEAMPLSTHGLAAADAVPAPASYRPVFDPSPALPGAQAGALASRTARPAPTEQADPLATAFGLDEGPLPWRADQSVLPARDAKAIRTNLSSFRSAVQRARGETAPGGPTQPADHHAP